MAGASSPVTRERGRASESEGEAASGRRGKSAGRRVTAERKTKRAIMAAMMAGMNSEGKHRRGVYRCFTFYDCNVYLAVDVTMNG